MRDFFIGIMRHGQITQALDYIQQLYAPEDSLLQEIRERLVAINMPIQIGPEEGKLLQLLISLAGIKSIVEIGTLAGYSSLWMARALPEDGILWTLEKEARHAAIARDFFARSGLEHKIHLLEGNALQSLQKIEEDGPFDMVFIDADKISYSKYLDWAEKHIRPGGLIIADNTLLFGCVYEDAPQTGVSNEAWQTMRSFNQRLANDDVYQSIMIPTKEGLTIAIRR